MENLSVGAKRYIGLTFLIGVFISAGQLLRLYFDFASINGLILLLLSVAAAFFNLFRVYGSNETDNYDLSWIVYGIALILLSSSAAAVVIWAAHLATFVWRRQRWPWYVHAFNVASFTIVNAISSLVYHAGLDWGFYWFGENQIVQIVSIFFAISTFTLLNHAHIAGVMWVVDGQDPRRSELFTPTSLLVDFTMLATGAHSALVAFTQPFALLFSAAPIYLIYKGLHSPMLEKQAQTDAKTGLYHSRHFKLLAEQELARANRLNRPLTLIMADLDLLRDINNTYGHLAGDLAIKTVAGILRKSIRTDDIAARFGGEEFVIVMVELPLEEALQRVELMRQSVENAMPLLPNGEHIKVTMSMGVAQRDVGDQDIDVLVQRADRALYLAKEAGRNRIGVHQQQTAILSRQALTAACVVPWSPTTNQPQAQTPSISR